MARPNGFVFRDDYLERLAKLSDQEVGRLVRALGIYHRDGEETKLAGRESVAFDFIRADIDRSDKSYAQKCETNRNNRLQSSSTVNGRARTGTNNNVNINPSDQDVEEDSSASNDARARMAAAFLKRVGRAANPEELDTLLWRMERFGMDEELCQEAIREAAAHGAAAPALYAEKLMQDWYASGYRTMDDYLDREEM